VAAAARLAAARAATTDSRPEKRLLALVTLYNAAYDSGSKAAVLMEALGYAKRAGLSDIMLPVIRAHADGWAGELQLGAGAERQLYTACADTLGACTRKPRTAAREAYRLLSKCLATYEVGAGVVGAGWEWWGSCSLGCQRPAILRQAAVWTVHLCSYSAMRVREAAQAAAASSSTLVPTFAPCCCPSLALPVAAGRTRG
jgi:hypothetical protein